MFPVSLILKKATVLLVATMVWVLPVSAAPAKDELAAIEYLIDYVGKSDVTFVRNFSRHSAARAMQHIQDKYDHFEDEIESPEQFIELCASKSLLTGREYSVIDAQGNEIPSREWMLGLLEDYRTTQGDKRAQ